MFERRAGRIGRCFAHEPDPEAVELDLEIVVPANGEPARVLITDGIITDQRTGECLEHEIRRLRFPST